MKRNNCFKAVYLTVAVLFSLKSTSYYLLFSWTLLQDHWQGDLLEELIRNFDFVLSV